MSHQVINETFRDRPPRRSRGGGEEDHGNELVSEIEGRVSRFHGSLRRGVVHHTRDTAGACQPQHHNPQSLARSLMPGSRVCKQGGEEGEEFVVCLVRR